MTHPRSSTSRGRINTLVEMCAKFIALHSHLIPAERLAELSRIQLNEAVQKYLGRVKQIRIFHEYRTYYPDGTPELLEHYDSEGRKHGKCLYWKENGKLESLLKYRNGLPHGSQKWYDQRGVLIKKLRFKKGKFEEEIIIEKKIYAHHNFHASSSGSKAKPCATESGSRRQSQLSPPLFKLLSLQ